MANQTPEQVTSLVQGIRKLGSDIHTLKQIKLNYPAMASTYDEVIDQLIRAREIEFAILGRDTFARLAGSVASERG